MSRFDCVLCGIDAEGQKDWCGPGGNKVCNACAAAILHAFETATGIESCSSNSFGLEIDWHDALAFVDQLQRDEERRAWRGEVVITDEAARDIHGAWRSATQRRAV